MNESQLNRALRLARRMGDRLLIMDQGSDNVLALLSLDEYERLMNSNAPLDGLDEEDMLRKVDHDISLWRQHHQGGDDNLGEQEDDEAPVMPSDDILNKMEGDSSVDESVEVDVTDEVKEAGRKGGSEEDLSDVPHEEEEEKFYLEPV